MKILVIFTGGTIGSQVNGNIISTNSNMKYLLLERYRAIHNDNIEFDTAEPYEILSENLTSEHLNSLINCVHYYSDKGYDGIIITHGTDTLQYSAAALGYSLKDCCPPVLLVSSNYPLEDKRANGYINLEAAVAFIAAVKAKGVFAAYSNDLISAEIHSATHMLSHSEMSDEIHSISGKAVAAYRDGKITVLSQLGNTLTQKTRKSITFQEESRILVIRSFPGDMFAYSLDKVSAVLMCPYHSGTVCTSSDKLKEFCKKTKEQKIPVFLTGVYSKVSYESTKAFRELGIIPLPQSTFPAMYIKLWLAISGKQDLKDFMFTPIADEFLK